MLSYIALGPVANSFACTTIFLSIGLGGVLFYYVPSLYQNYQSALFLLLAILVSFVLSHLMVRSLAQSLSDTFAFVSFLLLCGVLPFTILSYLILGNFYQKTHVLAQKFIMFAFGLGFGIILTQILFLNLFGVPWVIVLIAVLLLVCTVLSSKNVSQELITVSFMFAVMVICFGVNIQLNSTELLNPKFAEHSQSPVKAASPNESIINNLFGAAKIDSLNTYPYMALLHKILYLDLKANNQNVLVIGDGGYQLSDGNSKNLHFTFMNYYGNTRPSACTFLDVLTAGNNILTVDKNLQIPQGKYQIIISNIFPQTMRIPPALLSYQQIQKVRRWLPENGMAIFNVVARPTLTTTYSKRVDNTIRAVFPNCMEIPVTYSNKPTNILYVCKKSLQENDQAIYTANFDSARYV